eukprot:m.237544 g.237544  ORF g.237544 m.237544 type:complete len:189 (+) comp15272_c0_seq1:233-799(+)
MPPHEHFLGEVRQREILVSILQHFFADAACGVAAVRRGDGFYVVCEDGHDEDVCFACQVWLARDVHTYTHEDDVPPELWVAHQVQVAHLPVQFQQHVVWPTLTFQDWYNAMSQGQDLFIRSDTGFHLCTASVQEATTIFVQAPVHVLNAAPAHNANVNAGDAAGPMVPDGEHVQDNVFHHDAAWPGFV